MRRCVTIVKHAIERPAVQLFQTIDCEPPVVARIFVERMAERRHQVRIASGRQHARDLTHYLLRIADVLQHRIALHAREDTARKRKAFGIRHNVDARRREQIDVYVAGRRATCAADI